MVLMHRLGGYLLIAQETRFALWLGLMGLKPSQYCPLRSRDLSIKGEIYGKAEKFRRLLWLMP